MHIVVSEFIDEAALNQIGSDATVEYNPGLVETDPGFWTASILQPA